MWINKKYLAAVLVAGVGVTASAGMFELFDQMPVNGRLRTGAELIKPGGQDGIGALKITGNGNGAQYGYSYGFKVEPGKEYGMSFAYSTSGKLGFNGNGTAVVMVNFGNAKKQINPKFTKSFTLTPTRGEWKHRQIKVVAPAGAEYGEMVIRFIKVPASEYMIVDNFRWAPLAGERNFFNARKLDTIFDDWRFLGQQHFEHYILGKSAKVVMEWKKAKAGESFLQINGDGGKMQYPFKIENLTVAGDRNYRFSCWIKTTKHFKSGIKTFMFTCYDKTGRKVLGQPRKSVWFTNGEWQELVFDFTTPKGTEKLDIWFNMRHFPKEAEICIDQLKFEAGSVGPEMRQSFDPAAKTMTIACPVLGDLGQDSVAKTIFTVTDKAGKTVKTIEDKTYKPLTLKVDEFADGEYRIKADVHLKSGKVMSTAPRRYGIYKNPYWANNKIGVIADSAPAPAPWKDLVLKSNSVQTWNAAYDFTPALGIAQVTDKDGNKLLKKPLQITVNGKPVEAAGEIKWAFGKARTSAVVPVKGDDWSGKLNMIVDYIGFVRYGLDFDKKSGDINQMSVNYTLNETEFIHRADASWSAVGAVDLTTKKSYSTKHRYHEVIFGTVDRGLIWYAPQLYPMGDNFDNVVTSADIAGNFTMNLVNKPLKLGGKNYKMEFAICAYPTRPAGDNWKKYRFRAGKYNNFNMMSSMKAMGYCGLPASRNDELTQKQLSSIAKGGMMTLYQIPLYITDFMPEFRYFEKEWTGYPARYYNIKSWKDEPNAKMRKCDPRALLWHDLYCYMMQEYLKKFKWGGFYYDCYGSDLFSKNGVSMHPTFDVRTFHERIYLTGKAADKNFFTITHMGAQQGCTSMPFTDVALMGEQYRAQCMQNDYVLDFLTLNEFRYENAVNMGPDRMFLPQYRQIDKINSPVLAAHNVTMAFIHKNMLYPSFINEKVKMACLNKINEFNLENATFRGYWEKKNPDKITSSNDKVKASYYKNAKGFFIVLLNSVKSKQSTEVAIPVKYASAKVYDPINGSEVDLPGNGNIELGEYAGKFVIVNF